MNTCSRTFSTNAGGFDNVINPQFTITVNIINLENIGCINNEMQKFLIGLSGLNTPRDLFRLNRNMDDWRLRTI